jgi:hypothetical protein
MLCQLPDSENCYEAHAVRGHSIPVNDSAR